MLRSIQQRDLDRNRWIKITMGVILVLICVSMVVTLIPGLMSGTGASSPDAIATVAGQASPPRLSAAIRPGYAQSVHSDDAPIPMPSRSSTK